MESPLRGNAPAGTRLIETFGHWPGRGVPDWDLHMGRLTRGAEVLGYPFDRQDAAKAVAPLQDGPEPLRCRLTLGEAGDVGLTTAPLPAPLALWRFQIAPERLRSDDPWLRIKTTNRALYDRSRAGLPPGTDEWLFLNERDEVCEGTITSVFVETLAGQRLTPALGSGLLPGVLRQKLLSKGWSEAVLTLADLRAARRIWLGNALRGLIPAEPVGDTARL